MKGWVVSAKRRSRSAEAWEVVAGVAVAAGVGFSVLLMSVSFGVARVISADIANKRLRRLHFLNVGKIDTILGLLTLVVSVAVLGLTALTTFGMGVTMTRSRRVEIAVRRQSGVYRKTLVAEFLADMLVPVLVGGVVGEGLGVLVSLVISVISVLPVSFTPISLFSAFPVTVVLALVATLIPAWQAANSSPRLARQG